MVVASFNNLKLVHHLAACRIVLTPRALYLHAVILASLILIIGRMSILVERYCGYFRLRSETARLWSRPLWIIPGDPFTIAYRSIFQSSAYESTTREAAGSPRTFRNLRTQRLVPIFRCGHGPLESSNPLSNRRMKENLFACLHCSAGQRIPAGRKRNRSRRHCNQERSRQQD